MGEEAKMIYRLQTNDLSGTIDWNVIHGRYAKVSRGHEHYIVQNMTQADFDFAVAAAILGFEELWKFVASHPRRAICDLR